MALEEKKELIYALDIGTRCVVGVIGTAEPGETATITIPAQAAADLASGAINGLMLYSDDTGLYSDKNYSKNYMKFDGMTSGDGNTRPVLTVVYQ